ILRGRFANAPIAKRSNTCAHCRRVAPRWAKARDGRLLFPPLASCYCNRTSRYLNMQERFNLCDGGTLLYDEAFYAMTRAHELFATVKTEAPWRQERGRFGPFPRVTAWYADAGLTYAYSGVTHHAVEWTKALAQIRRDVEAASGAQFNSLLLNFYRDGQDS